MSIFLKKKKKITFIIGNSHVEALTNNKKKNYKITVN